MDRPIGMSGTAESSKLLIEAAADCLAPPKIVPRLPLLQRVIRQFQKTPRSPSPTGEHDAYKLKLIPEDRLVAHYIALLKRLQNSLGDNLGSYLEFGVYNGSSMNCMGQALDRTGLRSIGMFGFDSFCGLPPSAEFEDGGVWHAGQFACPRAVAEGRLVGLSKDSSAPAFIEGWFEDTLRGHDYYGIERASIVMVDSDTYSSARHVLKFLSPILTNPSIVIFDDWELNDLDLMRMGEYKAFHEWVRQYESIEFRFLKSYNRKSRTVLLRRASQS